MTRYEFLSRFRSAVEDGVAGDVDLDLSDLRYMADMFADVREDAEAEVLDLGGGITIDDGVYEDEDDFVEVLDDDDYETD
jgi:hypothetical protein